MADPGGRSNRPYWRKAEKAVVRPQSVRFMPPLATATTARSVLYDHDVEWGTGTDHRLGQCRPTTRADGDCSPRVAKAEA